MLVVVSIQPTYCTCIFYKKKAKGSSCFKYFQIIFPLWNRASDLPLERKKNPVCTVFVPPCRGGTKTVQLQYFPPDCNYQDLLRVNYRGFRESRWVNHNKVSKMRNKLWQQHREKKTKQRRIEWRCFFFLTKYHRNRGMATGILPRECVFETNWWNSRGHTAVPNS